MEEELTERQQRVLAFIESQIRKHGYPPTIREIGRHLGIKSTNGVNDHLNALQRKGYIKRQDHKSRTLAIVKSANDDADLPSSPVTGSSSRGVTGSSSRGAKLVGLEE